MAGGYLRHLNHAIDLNMWLRLALLGDVAETTAIQAIRRLHGNQLTAFYRANPARDFAALYANVRHFLTHEGATLEGVEVDHRNFAKRMSLSAIRTSARLFCRGQLEHSVALSRFALNVWRPPRNELSSNLGKPQRHRVE